MSDRADFEARLTAAYRVYTDRAPVDVDAVSMTAAVARGRTAGRWPFQARAWWLFAGTVLALLVLGAALLAGAQLLRPKTTIGGGGLLVVGQLDVPDAHFAQATGVHVFTLDATTGERVEIQTWPISQDVPGRWATWSPDRTHALLFGVAGTVPRIVDLPGQTSTPLRLSSDMSMPNGDDQFAWSPASDRVAVPLTDSASGIQHLGIFDLAGQGVASLSLPDGSGLGLPAWSPDGSSILLVGCLPCDTGPKPDPAVTPIPVPVPFDHLVIVPIDGSATRVLLEPTFIAGAAIWSPDGSTIAYPTQDGIATIAPADGRSTILTRGHDLDLRWSPDGHRIAFARFDDDGPIGIFVTDVDGSHLTQLTSGEDRSPDWSPDGGSLVFSRANPQAGGVYPSTWVVSSDGGTSNLLVTNSTVDW
jgi:Tol biopolymer transport system component